MPQHTLFGTDQISDLDIKIHLNTNGPGGSITVVVKDSFGSVTEAKTVGWKKDRDVSDLGRLLNEVANAFLWGECMDVTRMLISGARVHLPEVRLT